MSAASDAQHLHHERGCVLASKSHALAWTVIVVMLAVVASMTARIVVSSYASHSDADATTKRMDEKLSGVSAEVQALKREVEKLRAHGLVTEK